VKRLVLAACLVAVGSLTQLAATPMHAAAAAAGRERTYYIRG
jgi:hypothetical protein